MPPTWVHYPSVKVHPERSGLRGHSASQAKWVVSSLLFPTNRLLHLLALCFLLFRGASFLVTKAQAHLIPKGLACAHNAAHSWVDEGPDRFGGGLEAFAGVLANRLKGLLDLVARRIAVFFGLGVPAFSWIGVSAEP